MAATTNAEMSGFAMTDLPYWRTPGATLLSKLGHNLRTCNRRPVWIVDCQGDRHFCHG
jgi:hypothetical protein